MSNVVPVPSEEQQLAIQHIIDGDNVVLDAVAGSGKSTTILSMAQQLTGKRILQIAFNAMLRKEIKTKLKLAGIQNVKVHTFHSLAVRYYLPSAHTDTGIRKIMLSDMTPSDKIPHYDIIVLDEAQDMSFLYYQLMVKFAMDMGRPFQILVLGDFMQGIYEFKGADIRALTYASDIWKSHPYILSKTFHECTLKMSYRITRQMARFVNDVLLGEERLQAQKDGPPVVYLRNTPQKLEYMVVSKINQLLAEGASPSDIFVLGYSVKSIKGNIRKMENALVSRGIPCYVPMFDTEGIDDRVIEGKVVFSTFHSVKGRERKYVFVMGFDQSHFYFESTLPTDKCPNTIYVACTRATHQLFLLENDQFVSDRPFDFLKKAHHQMRDENYVMFKGAPRTIFYKWEKPATVAGLGGGGAAPEKFHDVSPTDLVKYVPEHILEAIAPLMDAIFIQEADPKEGDELDIPNMICTSSSRLVEKGPPSASDSRLKMYEDVCDLNGIAIPSMYYDHLYRLYAEEGKRPDNVGANILKHVINQCMCDTKPHEYLELKRLIDQMPDECETPADYLRLSNLYVAAKERLLFKLSQINANDYTWLSDEMVEKCMNRLDDIIGPECAEEPPLVEHVIIDREMVAEQAVINAMLSPHLPNAEKKFRFSARADLITRRCIWELKCTSVITIEHRMQVILYDWLWRVVNTPDLLKRRSPECVKPREVRIVNIKTGEIVRLNASFEDLTTIVVELLRGKYEKSAPKTNEEFLSECHSFMSSYVEKCQTRISREYIPG
ncbi:DUF2075 domain-containing protein [bacterium]|nr:DUF2075 domain-containing protein [bacterium]